MICYCFHFSAAGLAVKNYMQNAPDGRTVAKIHIFSVGNCLSQLWQTIITLAWF